MSFILRPAQKTDAATLAVLADMAGHGLPSLFWAQAREKGGFASVVEAGRDRILNPESALSFTKMTVAEAEGDTAGMLLDYAIDPPMAEEDIADQHPVLRSLLRLEAEAPGSWYINMLAVFREYRGTGIGAALIEESIRRAGDAGTDEISLIAEDNNPALGLYEKSGFKVRAKESFEPFEGSEKKDGNWILMVRAT